MTKEYQEATNEFLRVRPPLPFLIVAVTDMLFFSRLKTPTPSPVSPPRAIPARVWSSRLLASHKWTPPFFINRLSGLLHGVEMVQDELGGRVLETTTEHQGGGGFGGVNTVQRRQCDIVSFLDTSHCFCFVSHPPWENNNYPRPGPTKRIVMNDSSRISEADGR